MTLYDLKPAFQALLRPTARRIFERGGTANMVTLAAAATVIERVLTLRVPPGTKIAPTLTPSKTVEGFLGGVASATALGAALWWITPFCPWQAAALSLVIALMGFLGGLVMSAIKRDRGVKDWGRMIRGHGGMLDRMDSLIFAAPIFFHLTRYWFTV